MGRHPSRDEIASADYWGGECVGCRDVCTGRRERRGSCRLGLMAAPLVREQGAREADRLFPQSVLQQPPLTHGPARRQAGRKAGKTGTDLKTQEIFKAVIHDVVFNSNTDCDRREVWRIIEGSRKDKN